eukprot:365042-Chlamydomonas_euryale.AAC.41
MHNPLSGRCWTRVPGTSVPPVLLRERSSQWHMAVFVSQLKLWKQRRQYFDAVWTTGTCVACSIRILPGVFVDGVQG